MILDAIAFVLIAFAAVNVISTSVLIRAALRHHWPALEERATVAAVLAVAAVGGAALGLARLRLLDLPPGVSLALMAVGLVLISVPSIVWLFAYWTGQFDEPDSSGRAGRP